MSEQGSTKRLPEIIRSRREHPQRMSPETLADALANINARLRTLEKHRDGPTRHAPRDGEQWSEYSGRVNDPGAYAIHEDDIPKNPKWSSRLRGWLAK